MQTKSSFTDTQWYTRTPSPQTPMCNTLSQMATLTYHTSAFPLEDAYVRPMAKYESFCATLSWTASSSGPRDTNSTTLSWVLGFLSHFKTSTKKNKGITKHQLNEFQCHRYFGLVLHFETVQSKWKAQWLYLKEWSNGHEIKTVPLWTVHIHSPFPELLPRLIKKSRNKNTEKTPLVHYG